MVIVLPVLMVSCLSSGRNTNCDQQKAPGGIASDLFLTEHDAIDDLQFDIDGRVTAIIMQPNAVFYRYTFYDETAEFKESLTNENCIPIADQTFEMIWRKRKQADRNAIMELANCCCGMIAIHKEMTGTTWIWGYNEKQRVKLRTAEGTSGKELNNPNQETLVLGARAIEKAVEFVPGIEGIPV